MTSWRNRIAVRVMSERSVVVLIAIAYFAALALIDSERGTASLMADLANGLPLLLIASLMAYFIRGLRWLMLLRAFGHFVPVCRGLFGYVAGFAFTASPGKAGELVRIRYFGRSGVPASHVVAAFVFERMLDLAVLLLFASLLGGSAVGFGLAVVFVGVVLAAVIAVARWPRMRYRIQYQMRRLGLRLLPRWVRIVLRGVEQTSGFVSVGAMAPAVLLGLFAWGVQCAGYMLTLHALGISLPAWVLFAIPPAAILIGAASLLPGGIGTTEAATVVVLTQFGAPLDSAVLGSIALRLGSIWFATLLGFAAIGRLELGRSPP